jgi:superoxide dismutase, Cu-Zn family
MNLHNTSTRIINLSSLALAIIIIAGGCAQTETIEIEREFNAPKISKAVAVLHPTDGFDAKGTIYFTAVENGVQVTAEISGLSEGNKGFHIHQYGDCTAANGTSAGGHFNPEGMDHAGPTDAIRHMGDMGNITANAQGNAMIDYVDKTIHINMILGRGVIVHNGEDDLSSQPSGAAGPRVACGVIGVASASE